MPSDERFAVVRRTLEKAGWRLDRVTGSHHVFTKVGGQTVSVPVHRGKVKPFYVGQIEKLTQSC